MNQSVLFVCLGNICRSPAAEGVFLNLIKQNGLDSQYIVDSAGTGGWHVGKRADSRMRFAASKRGIEIPSISRQISIEDFESFDYILTMDKDNYETVMSLFHEQALKKKPIIKPILSYSSEQSLKEIPDPYYGGEDGFEIVLDLLEDACQCFLQATMNRE